VSLYAEPVQSLSDVAYQLSHAALLTQRFHDGVQLLEEVYSREGEGETELLKVTAAAEMKQLFFKRWHGQKEASSVCFFFLFLS